MAYLFENLAEFYLFVPQFNLFTAERTQVTTKSSGKTSTTTTTTAESATSTTTTADNSQTPAPTWINDIFQVILRCYFSGLGSEC